MADPTAAEGLKKLIEVRNEIVRMYNENTQPIGFGYEEVLKHRLVGFELAIASLDRFISQKG